MRACVNEQTTLLAQPPAQAVVRLAQCRKSLAPGHPCGLRMNSAGVGKNDRRVCPDCAWIAQNGPRRAAPPGRRARIQQRRSRGLSSVKGNTCSTRAKIFVEQFRNPPGLPVIVDLREMLEEDSQASPRHLLVENRIHGRPPDSGPQGITIGASRQNHPIWPLT
jgi:hypothetical protein